MIATYDCFSFEQRSDDQTNLRPSVSWIRYRIPHSSLIITPSTDSFGILIVELPVGLLISSSNSCIEVSGTGTGLIWAYTANRHAVFGGSSGIAWTNFRKVINATDRYLRNQNPRRLRLSISPISECALQAQARLWVKSDFLARQGLRLVNIGYLSVDFSRVSHRRLLVFGIRTCSVQQNQIWTLLIQDEYPQIRAANLRCCP